MFRCKGDDAVIRSVSSIYLDRAWLAAITSCRQRLYKKYGSIIPMVNGLELSAEGTSVSITWNADNRYYTEVQIRNDDGDWETLSLVAKGVGEL